ncbi:hypothetical protein D3C73_951740 [compost metagenome]
MPENSEKRGFTDLADRWYIIEKYEQYTNKKNFTIFSVKLLPRNENQNTSKECITYDDDEPIFVT